MFKQLWVERGMLSGLTKKKMYFSYSYTVTLTSILAAGIVQNTFAGEAGEG